MQLADSINLDPHKALNIPFGVGTLIVRDGQNLKQAMSKDLSCFRTNPLMDTEVYSPVDYTFELSRPARALPIWFSLRLLGLKTFRLFLEEKLDLAIELHKIIKQMDCFIVKPNRIELPIFIFRYDDENDERTQGMMSFINTDSPVNIRTVNSDGYVWIRVAIFGYRTHRHEVDSLLELIKEHRDSNSKSKPIASRAQSVSRPHSASVRSQCRDTRRATALRQSSRHCTLL